MTRAEFFQRLQPFHAPSTILDIELAYTMSKYGHRAQVRKESDDTGKPVRYFEHPKRVALILIDLVKIVDPTMVISCLIHDGLEDTRDLTPEMIEHIWGTDVVKIVKTLSKTPKEGYLNRFFMSTDWRPYVIKGCDRLDNLSSLAQTSLEFQQRQIAETKEKYYPLFDRMVSLTPMEYKVQVQGLRDLIFQKTEAHGVAQRGGRTSSFDGA